MGLFSKIKNILFEDDEEELQEMPVYGSGEEKEVPVETVTPEVNEPIKINERSHFSNVKRDIDFSFDDNDVLDDIINVKEKKVEEEIKLPSLKNEEKKSVFLAFDEDEFDRMNSRVNKNEARVRQDIRANTVPNLEARKANNNFSSTSTSRDNKVDNDRYRISSVPAKKTFTPSPIISPVYGILDKNYSKDDIVDKKDGLKREKIVKPMKKGLEKTIEEAEKELENEVSVVSRKEVVVEETKHMDIDSVRKKAFGELEDLEKSLKESNLSNLKEVKVLDEKNVSDDDLTEFKSVDLSVEDEIETKFSVQDIELEDEEKELDKVVEEVIDKKNVKSNKKPQLLDDLEKTSTLQILDDIEKELNSIKPMSDEIDLEDEDYNIAKDESLEKDLFNLIDSMYESGEEEDEND